MHDERATFSGIVGYRQKPWNILGNQARVATIRGGRLRVVDAAGHADRDVPLAGATAESKRGIIRIQAGEERFCLYGFSATNKVPEDLLGHLEDADDVVGPAQGNLATAGPNAAREGQKLLAALRAAGAYTP